MRRFILEFYNSQLFGWDEATFEIPLCPSHVVLFWPKVLLHLVILPAVRSRLFSI